MWIKQGVRFHKSLFYELDWHYCMRQKCLKLIKGQLSSRMRRPVYCHWLLQCPKRPVWKGLTEVVFFALSPERNTWIVITWQSDMSKEASLHYTRCAPMHTCFLLAVQPNLCWLARAGKQAGKWQAIFRAVLIWGVYPTGKDAISPALYRQHFLRDATVHKNGTTIN